MGVGVDVKVGNGVGVGVGDGVQVMAGTESAAMPSARRYRSCPSSQVFNIE
jgi:hypothetical protein